MLEGKKPLAAFANFLPSPQDSEKIIPQQAFSPYVQQGRILRFDMIVKSQKTEHAIFYVCYALPDEIWRAHAYLGLRKLTHSQAAPDDAHSDAIFGRLLGYSEEDIAAFLSE